MNTQAIELDQSIREHLGPGAFAVEGMRSALERRARHVTLLCHRRGTVCPQLIDCKIRSDQI